MTFRRIPFVFVCAIVLYGLAGNVWAQESSADKLTLGDFEVMASNPDSYYPLRPVLYLYQHFDPRYVDQVYGSPIDKSVLGASQNHLGVPVTKLRYRSFEVSYASYEGYNKVVDIKVFDGEFETPRGATVGTSLPQLLRLYGTQNKSEKLQDGSFLLDYYIDDPLAWNEITTIVLRFAIDPDKVGKVKMIEIYFITAI